MREDIHRKSPEVRQQALNDIIHRNNPWVIVMQVTDGPLPTLLRDPGNPLPWNTINRYTAERTLADLKNDKRIVKAEIMRAREAVKYIVYHNSAQ